MGLSNNLGKLSNMITSTGSAVGIAQASPAYTLDVTGTGRFTGALTCTSASFSLGVTIANDNWIKYNDTGSTARNILILASDNNLYIQYKAGNNLLIRDTDGTERMRITSGGFLKASNNGTYIGATGSYHELRNTNTNATDNVALITGLGSTSNNTSNYHLIAATNGADKLYIYGNGNVVNINGSYGTLSDIALKENIIDATPKLDDLLQLKVRNFNLIDDKFKAKQIGFIAQEFEEVFPKMIDIDGKSGMKTIKTSVLVPMLVKAIQELSAQNQDLKSRLDKAGL